MSSDLNNGSSNGQPEGPFSGQCALVTGAARGIGEALANELASLGARVAVTDLNVAEAARVAARLPGHGHVAYQLDVTDSQRLDQVRREIHRDMGPIQVLVNNAGVVFGGAFLDVPVEKHRLTLRINAEAVVAITHAFLADLIASDRGRILQVASASGFLGLPFGSSYAASKWAVVGFSESLRMELKNLGHDHVTVTALCPSYIRTGLFKGVRPPRFTRWLTPKGVAAKAVVATIRGKRRVMMPWLAKTAPMLVGAPAPISDAISTAVGAANSMQSWRGHE